MFTSKQTSKKPKGKSKDTDKKVKDFTAEQKEKIIARGNPPIDNNVIRGYN